MTYEEKRAAIIASRPACPKTREEFDAWLAWHADADNRYFWDFDLSFELNGHTISTNSGQFGHIVVDWVLRDVRDEYCTIHVGKVTYKPTDYIKMKIFGE